MYYGRRPSESGAIVPGFLFWGWVFVLGTSSKQGIIIWSIVTFVVIIVYVISYIEKNKCPHGVFKGKTWKNGKCKCPQCQEDFIVYRQQTELREQEAIRIKQLERQYKEEVQKSTDIKRKILLSGSSIVTSLSPFEFEDYIALLLKRLGFTDIKQTPYQNDGGKDIICFYKGEKHYVECKHFKSSNKVSRPLMQKLFAAMTEDNVKKGLFFTTSSFSTGAIEYGQQHHIRTIDGEELARIIAENQPQEEYPTTYELPCPKCGLMVGFKYLDKPTTILCPNGHSVDSIPEIELFPKHFTNYL